MDRRAYDLNDQNHLNVIKRISTQNLYRLSNVLSFPGMVPIDRQHSTNCTGEANKSDEYSDLKICQGASIYVCNFHATYAGLTWIK